MVMSAPKNASASSLQLEEPALALGVAVHDRGEDAAHHALVGERNAADDRVPTACVRNGDAIAGTFAHAEPVRARAGRKRIERIAVKLDGVVRIELPVAAIVHDDRLLAAEHEQREAAAVGSRIESGRGHRRSRNALPPFLRHIDLQPGRCRKLELLFLLCRRCGFLRLRAGSAETIRRHEDGAVQPQPTERRWCDACLCSNRKDSDDGTRDRAHGGSDHDVHKHLAAECFREKRGAARK